MGRPQKYKTGTRNQVYIGDSLAVLICPATENGKRFAVTIDKEDVARVQAAGYWRVHNFSATTGHWHPYCFTIASRKVVFLHRYLMDTPKRLVTDHINRRTTDNRKCNLRICTHGENIRNQKARSNTGIKHVHLRKDGLYGVSWSERGRNRSEYFHSIEAASEFVRFMIPEVTA